VADDGHGWRAKTRLGEAGAADVAAELGEKILLRKIERVVDPILNKIGGKGGNQSGSGNPPQGGSNGGGNKGPAGGYALREGRCTLRPYQPNRCPPGQTGHHVVPDHCFTQPGGERYANVPSNAKGLVICVGGAGKHTNQDGSSAGSLKKLIKKTWREMKGSTLQEKAEAALAVKHGYISNLAEHGRIHFKFDAQEQAEGMLGKPPGTMELGKMEAMAAKVVAEETGCDAKDLEKQLREHHKSDPYKLGEKALVRADPFGQVKGLDITKMGRPDQIPGAGR
jgi:hypothetical protein